MRALLPLLLILAGCGSVSQVTAANGSAAYQVDCGGLLGSGIFGNKLDCNMKASQMCPSGFNPIDSPPGRLVFTCSRRPVPATAPI